MEKRIQIGSRYKEAVLKMSGGYGRWAWNATCYLKSEEFALWNKICEYSYRCQDPNGVLHLKKQSLYNYFSFDGGKEYVERNLESLANIGYIKTKGDNVYVDIQIDMDAVTLATKYVGKNRHYAQALRKMCEVHNGSGNKIDKSVLDITSDDLVDAEHVFGEEA